MSNMPKSTQFQQILFQGKEKLGNSKVYKVHQLAEEEKVVGLLDSMALHNIGGSLGTGNYKAGYKVTLFVENIEVSLELDTGCALTLCPIDFYEKHFNKLKLKSCNVKLLTYSGSKVNNIGQLQVNVSYESQSYNIVPLVVVNIDKMGQPMLFGRNRLENIVLD